jgi:hypothetical protein
MPRTKAGRRGARLRKTSKATRLVVAVRRMQIRRRNAEALKQEEREARKQARHEQMLSCREKTGRLAHARIAACKRYPSVFAVKQLMSLAQDPRIPAAHRVKAASTLLRWCE